MTSCYYNNWCYKERGRRPPKIPGPYAVPSPFPPDSPADPAVPSVIHHQHFHNCHPKQQPPHFIYQLYSLPPPSLGYLSSEFSPAYHPLTHVRDSENPGILQGSFRELTSVVLQTPNPETVVADSGHYRHIFLELDVLQLLPHSPSYMFSEVGRSQIKHVPVELWEYGYSITTTPLLPP